MIDNGPGIQPWYNLANAARAAGQPATIVMAWHAADNIRLPAIIVPVGDFGR